MDFPKQILSACCLPGYGLNKDGNVLVRHSGKSTMDPATNEQSSKKEPILGGGGWLPGEGRSWAMESQVSGPVGSWDPGELVTWRRREREKARLPI